MEVDALRFWLSEELKRRGWSQRELARQTGISQGFVNRVLSGDAKPSVNFCLKVARVLDVSPVYVLQLAGILPDDVKPPPGDDNLQEILTLARALPPDKRQQVVDYLRFLLGR